IVMPAGEIPNEPQDSTPTSDFLNNTISGTVFQKLQNRRASGGKRGWLISGIVLAALALTAGYLFKGAPTAGTVNLDVDQTDLTGAVATVEESAPMPFPMTEREIVEWVLNVGGTVTINSDQEELTSIKEFPAELVDFYSVSLSDAVFSPHDLQRLANLKPLYVLRLSGDSIGEQDFQYLKYVNGVHDLNLERFTIEGDGLKYLSGFQSLKAIRVYDSTIRGEGLSHLGQFLNLITLDLVACTIDSGVMQQIGNRRQLNFLNLSNSQIDDVGLAHLSGLTKLKKFYAHLNPKITDEGVKSLSGMPELELLTLGRTGITDVGLKQIAGYEKLIRLDIYNTRITDAGLEYLTKLKHL
ncbi:MAG: hypothetical protein KDA74_25480, partial [Planctomycetaceae bacterium]|nr:hypothetical protein [Planctomycetaceae bacterium]